MTQQTHIGWRMSCSDWLTKIVSLNILYISENCLRFTWQTERLLATNTSYVTMKDAFKQASLHLNLVSDLLSECDFLTKSETSFTTDLKPHSIIK